MRDTVECYADKGEKRCLIGDENFSGCRYYDYLPDRQEKNKQSAMVWGSLRRILQPIGKGIYRIAVKVEGREGKGEVTFKYTHNG